MCQLEHDTMLANSDGEKSQRPQLEQQRQIRASIKVITTPRLKPNGKNITIEDAIQVCQLEHKSMLAKSDGKTSQRSQLEQPSMQTEINTMRGGNIHAG